MFQRSSREAQLNFEVFFVAECAIEGQSLKQRCASLQDDIKHKQAESKFLERKHRELHSTSFMYEQERSRLQKLINQLTGFINAYR